MKEGNGRISAREYAEMATRLEQMAGPLERPGVELAEARGQMVFFLRRAAKLARQSAEWLAEKEGRDAD